MQKASELIKCLEDLIKKHGDKNIEILDGFNVSIYDEVFEPVYFEDDDIISIGIAQKEWERNNTMTNISTRDYFAAKAMVELMRTKTTSANPIVETIAIGAYLMADAMIKESKRSLSSK